MDVSIGLGLIAIGAGISMGAGAIGTGIGQGNAVAGALQAMARNPEMESQIRSTMLLGCGIAESSAIYALLISGGLFYLVFSNMPA